MRLKVALKVDTSYEEAGKEFLPRPDLPIAATVKAS